MKKWPLLSYLPFSPYKSLLFREFKGGTIKTYQPPEILLRRKVGDCLEMEVEGWRFYWPAAFQWQSLKAVYSEVFSPIAENPHAYEQDDLEIKPGDWVIDAGACEGFFTRYALQRGANVVIVEPIHEFVGALKITYEAEVNAGRVFIIEGALGDHSGEIEIRIPSAGPIASTIDPEWFVDSHWEKVKREDSRTVARLTRVYTIDELIDRIPVPRLDFIKMDIENAEVRAMRGAEQAILRFQPRFSIAVYHSLKNGQQIATRLKALDKSYRIWFGGVFFRKSFGPPRPYMLYARPE